MKIQINSLEALERLIGNDNEMEIQVRNSVVQDFTNKHLKGIANEYVKNGYLKSLEQAVANDVFESTGGWNATYTLKPAFKQVVAEFTKDLIRKEIQEVVDSLKATGKLEDMVKSAVGYQILIEVEKIRKELIVEEAKKQIQEKFK